MQKSKLNIYDYTDFKSFLKDYFAERKKDSYSFSLRKFTKSIGFKSSGYLTMIISGQRNLTNKNIHIISKAIQLGQKESKYFETLVLYNQAKTEKESSYYLERLIQLKPNQNLTGIKKDQYEFFSKPYYLMIYQLVLLPDFKEDYTWISNRLVLNLKQKDIKEAIDLLLRLKLLTRNKNKELVQTNKGLKTETAIESLDAFRLQYYLLDLAKYSLNTIPEELRDYKAMTLNVPNNKLEELKIRTQEFFEKTLDWLNKIDGNGDEVYQLNCQLFPVTRNLEKNTKE